MHGKSERLAWARRKAKNRVASEGLALLFSGILLLIQVGLEVVAERRRDLVTKKRAT